MRIAHVSDIHVRNLKYHAEYRNVFENLYRKLDELKPDVVVNTGDSAHSKTQISPELVQVLSEHIRRVSEYAPYHIIRGNHDLNLMNSDRQDAITPIVQSIDSPRVFLHKKSGIVPVSGDVNFWIYEISEPETYPTEEEIKRHADKVNIGLFHGSIRNCVTDSNWRMTHTEHDLSIFNGLDYVLMGDIHKQQFMDRNKRIAYAGSLVQQNFGEDVKKGFLVWDIYDKKSHDVSSIYLEGSRPFVTIDLNEDKTLPTNVIPTDARVRIRPKCPLSLVEQKAIERQVKKKYGVSDVITLSVTNIGSSRSSIGKTKVAHENMRDLAVQDKLIRRFLKSKQLPEPVLKRITDLNRKYQVDVDQRDDGARDVSWRLKKIVWSNLFNYGEQNIIDFSSLKGMTGIFAPNASGKSNMIDVIMQTLFDSTTKGISKNIFLINDNKDQAIAVAEIETDDKHYILERQIERVKYGQRSGASKEWGKTSVNFYGVSNDGVKESLNGVSRPETEREIRKKVGTFDDAMLTSLFAQWNPMDVIQCKETERKRILYRFMDLDVFEQKGELAKKDAREHYDRLRELEDAGLADHASSYRKRSEELSEAIATHEGLLEQEKSSFRSIDSEMMTLGSQRVKIEAAVDHRDALAGIVKADKTVLSFLGQISLCQIQILKFESELSSTEPDDELMGRLKVSHDRRDELERELKMLAKDRDNVFQVVQTYKKKLPLLREVPCGDQYPSCKFLIDAFSSKEKLPPLEEDLKQLSKRYDDMSAEFVVVSAEASEYDAAQRRVETNKTLSGTLQNLKLKLENLGLKVSEQEMLKTKAEDELARFDRIAEDVKKNSEVDVKLSQLLKQKVSCEKKQSDVQSTINSLIHERGQQSGLLDSLESELSLLKETRELCAAYEHYAEAMGKDGIAFDILKQKLPLINDEINKILSSAADFNVHVEHDAEEESIRIYIQYSEYKQRLIELGSGAEKFLSSIAIRNALTNISNLPKTNIFIIDEGFGKLDPKNVENVSRMFDYLRTVFDHIIVISHSDVMKDMVDNMIEITTDEEGYAHVEV